jgi:hypothetical protein
VRTDCPLPAAPAPARARLRAAFATVLLTVAVTAVAGCGSSSSSTPPADPASIVPASAVLYAGAVVRPEGSLKTSAIAVGRALAHEADPYLHLLAALQTPGSRQLQYARDIAPWLGGKAALFLSSVTVATTAEVTRLVPLIMGSLTGGGTTAGAWPFSKAGLQGALVLDTSDAAKARAFLTAQAGRAGAQSASYKGVAYEQSTAGVAFAFVHGFAVIGSSKAVQSVIDTSLGAPALARASRYSTVVAGAPADTLAHIFTSASAYGSKPQGLPALLGLFAGAREANVSVVPAANSITLDVDTASTPSSAPGGLLYSGTEATQALGALPGESWLALGVGDVGGTLAADVKGLESLATLGTSLGGSAPAAKRPSTSGISISGLSVKSLLKGLLTPLAVMGAETPTARRVFASWMGSAGIFAGGSSLLELEGAVVISSKSAALSRAAVPALEAGLQRTGASVQTLSTRGTEASFTASVSGLPLLLVVAAGRDSAGQPKFVIGLGSNSVSAALNPTSTLSGSASYREATKALGGTQPGIIANVPTVLALLEGAGLAEDPTIGKLVPFLRGVTTVSAGDESAGTLRRFKLVVGLH